MSLKLTIDQIIQNAAISHKEGKFEEVEDYYKKFIELKPDIAEVYYNLAVVQYTLNKLDKAEESYKKTISLKPDMSQAYHNLGTIYSRTDRLEEAEKYYKKAIDITPDYVEAYNNLGIVFHKLKKTNEAELSFKKALKIKPDFFKAYNNIANSLRDQSKFEESILYYKKAIEVKPDYVEAHFNLGAILKQIGKMSDSEKSFIKALELNPNYADAHLNLGLVLKDLFRFGEAEASFKKVIKLKPDSAEAYFCLGNIVKLLQREEESVAFYDKAMAINPDLDFLLGALIFSKMQLCIWDNTSKNVLELIKKIDDGKKASTPFTLHSIIDNPRIHRKCAEIFSKDQYPKSNIFPHIPPYKGHKKIKIGYFSPDFKNHAVSHQTAELYEVHNRNKFEIHAFSFGPDIKDEFNIRIKKGVDYFHNVQLISDRDVVKLARSLEIDIAIDLSGFTSGSRTGIFAMSAAPIQVSYIGFIGTMGTNYHDYLIADKVLINKENKKYYSEKIIYLPTFQVNQSIKNFDTIIPDNQDLIIPEDSFVFCCFNNTYKIKPEVFNCWIRILKQVENGILIFLSKTESASNNLRTQIIKNGINPKRVIFGKKLPRNEYLARFKIADLFLDTFPLNGGATVSDSLRMGVPVVTRIGNSLGGRMGASLLNGVGLTELVTNTDLEYESLAIDLAKNPQKLKTIKDKFVKNLPTAALYDTQLFTKNLESAYQIMYEKNQKGLEPDDIEINNKSDN